MTTLPAIDFGQQFAWHQIFTANTKPKTKPLALSQKRSARTAQIMEKRISCLTDHTTIIISNLLLSSLLACPTWAQSTDKQTGSGDANSPPLSAELHDIMDEQSDLRHDLKMLKQDIEQIQQRLEKLEQLSELQRNLDIALSQLRQAESDEDVTRTRNLEPKVEKLRQRIDQARETMDRDTEILNRISEIRELKQQIDNLPGSEINIGSSRHLHLAIGHLTQLKRMHTILRKSDSGSEQQHDAIEKKLDELQERVDFDNELVELGFRLVKAMQNDNKNDVEELTQKISEVLDEMESQPQMRMAIPNALASIDSPDSVDQSNPDENDSSILKSGQYFIRQSWSQATDYPRPYFVNVPRGNERQKFPVFIFLHGNGGNAREVMPILLRNRKELAAKYIMVFAQGYQESWNIVSERSKADDKGFIESIVLKLGSFENVQKDNFSVMGASNGAALVNQLLIESRLPNIRNFISGVSPLNVWQHDGEQFKSKGLDNNYRNPAQPMKGKRLLNISGTNDQLVPYEGGLSKHIPAKNGKLGFLAAEESTYLWAKQMGQVERKLVTPSWKEGRIEVFNYLDGDVLHYKVVGAGHGATHEISEQSLLNFLEDSGLAKEKEK